MIYLIEEEVHGGGFKLTGIQLFTKKSVLIESFGAIIGRRKLITLGENELWVGLKAAEIPESKNYNT